MHIDFGVEAVTEPISLRELTLSRM